MFENPRRGRQATKFSTNVPKILDLKSSSEEIFSENCRWVPLVHQVHRALPIRMGNKNKALRSGGTNDSSTVEKCDVAGVRKGRGLGVREKSERRFTFPLERLPDWKGVHVLKILSLNPSAFAQSAILI